MDIRRASEACSFPVVTSALMVSDHLQNERRSSLDVSCIVFLPLRFITVNVIFLTVEEIGLKGKGGTELAIELCGKQASWEASLIPFVPEHTNHIFQTCLQ